jgi:hypothetical protein
MQRRPIVPNRSRPKPVDISKAERFYKAHRSGATSQEVLERFLKERKAIVFGARAVNQQLPSHLDRRTEDWDILTPKNPANVAKTIERSLDKRYGANFFLVEPALHPGTFKVRSIVSGATVADVSGLTEVIPNVKINGINYATLDHQVSNIKISLADEGSRFRHAKDRETLQRIDIFRSNNPTYFVSDLTEVLRDEFDLDLNQRAPGVFSLTQANGSPPSKEQSASLGKFMSKFYPQLSFRKTAKGNVVIRRI